MLHRAGPTTAYAVRQEFARSPSSHWSGSAGAVYPALRRLEKAGAVASQAVPDSGRQARQYSLTEVGQEMLRTWLLSPVTSADAAYLFDPIRLRVFFFSSLTRNERVQVVRDAIRQLENERRRAAAHNAMLGPQSDRFGVWGGEGAQRILDARLNWFQEILAALLRESDTPPSL